jgi:peroxiredoxin-like protein
MQPLPHHYHVRLDAGRDAYAVVSDKDLPRIRTAAPPGFGGPGDAWTPENLLLAAVETCFLFTLRAVARASRIDIVRVEVETSGTVGRQDGVIRFTDIVVRPRLTVSQKAGLDRVAWLVDKAERACLVAASLSTPVRVEPQIAEADVPAAAPA